jgi:hypothetical protein
MTSISKLRIATYEGMIHNVVFVSFYINGIRLNYLMHTAIQFTYLEFNQASHCIHPFGQTKIDSMKAHDQQATVTNTAEFFLHILLQSWFIDFP